MNDNGDYCPLDRLFRETSTSRKNHDDDAGSDDDDEQWMEEVIGIYTFYVKFAQDDCNTDKKALFATMIWPGTRALSTYLCNNKKLLVGKTIVELGAGVGLPSLVVSRVLSPLRVVATDFPAPSVLANLAANMDKNNTTTGTTTTHTLGYRWGDDVTPLLALNQGELFDAVLCSECLWKEDTHDILIVSLTRLLKRKGGIAFLGFSHHHPGREHRDLHFFELAAQAHLIVTSIHTVQVPYMWANGDDSKHVPFYIYELQFSSSV